MSMPRANATHLVRALAIASAIGLTAASPARAQYPFGPGFAYGGVGYGYGFGYGMGYGLGYGYGPWLGYGGFGYPGYAIGPLPVMSVVPPAVAGFPGPYGGFGFNYGYGYGIPGYGPTGIGYANPLFGLGLSPLAVNTAIAERALVTRPIVIIDRRAPQAATSTPNPPAQNDAGVKPESSPR